MGPSLGRAPGRSYLRPPDDPTSLGPMLPSVGPKKALKWGFPVAPWDLEKQPSVGGLWP